MAPLRVLVLDEGFVSGALAALGLSEAGCDVHVLAATGGRGAYRGRRGTWEQLPRVGTPGLQDAIGRRVHEGGYDVVHPVTEPMQRLAWDAGWPGVFPSADASMRRRFGSKRCMSAAVAATGAPVPAEADASTDAEVCAGIERLGLPVVVKGCVGRGGSATVIAKSGAQARAAAARMRERGTAPFLQEFIPGTTWLVGGVFDDGNALRLFAAKKTIQFPSGTGPAAELLSGSEPALLGAATRVFRAARMSGVASVDFIHHPDGRFLFLELNPRPWGSMAAAARAGVDLWDPLARLWRGEQVAPALDFSAGVRVGTWPLYLVARRSWSVVSASQLARDVSAAASIAASDPALAWHLVERCSRAALTMRAELAQRAGGSSSHSLVRRVHAS